MRPKNTPIGVNLIQDNKREIPEQILPVLMIGQNAEMKHIRIREQYIRRFAPDLLAPVWTGVAVIDVGQISLAIISLIKNERLFIWSCSSAFRGKRYIAFVSLPFKSASRTVIL